MRRNKDNRFITAPRLVWGGLLLSLLYAACSQEREESPLQGRSIGFSVTALAGAEGKEADMTESGVKGRTAAASAADTLPAVQVIALKGDDAGERLYLHALITDGMGQGTPAHYENGPTTKAAPVDNATMYDEMAVTAFIYPATHSWPTAYTGGSPSAQRYMSAVKVKKSEAWSTTYHWPGASKRISFFAAAPYGSGGLTAFNDGTPGTLPYLSYTVPANVADQKDLLVAASTDRPGNSNTAEPLTMKHALTAVRFVTGDDMLAGTVSKITLKNVYGTGRLPMQAAPAWYSLSGTRNFELTLSPAATAPDPQVPNTPLTTADATFMMLPQTLPSGAQIEVKYTDKLTNTQRTLTANIAGKTWPMGKTVVYRISTSSISVTSTLEVTAPAEYTYQGGNSNYTVKSYASVSGGGATANVPIAWEVEYSTDGGANWNNTKPAWLTTFTENGTGGTSAAPYTATVVAQVNSATAHTEALKNTTPVTNYDLSTHNYQGNIAPMRTANCYIVNAPGTYRLPLVYGNAIDKVKVPGTGNNTSAYTSSAPASYEILSTFINHRGVGITNPYIYNNANCTPAKCTLIWQDAQNLVTNVALSSDRHFLQFTVGQTTICQGNAVVAVRDASNTVLWSWHIWVTDYRPGTIGTTTPDKEITNHQNKKYKIMTVNLGWCDGKEETYAERTVQVRFKQKPTAGYTSATPKTFTVKQKAHTITELGNNTYYQWGRKDPFVGASPSILSINKTWYDADGNVKTDQPPAIQSFPYGTLCIAHGITNPSTLNTNSFMDSQYYNLWDANNNVNTNNDNLVVKTVYDPCPAGYKLPPSNVFTGFTTTGQGTSTQSQFNVQGPWNKGWNFYCDPSKTTTVFFPASGFRYGNTALLTNVESSAVYWTAGPNPLNYWGWDLTLYEGGVYPLNRNFRNYGLSVRATQE